MNDNPIKTDENIKSKFDFYEIVKIISKAEKDFEALGLEGAITGMAEDDDGRWGYSVHIYALDDTWYFLETEIEATGRMDKRETFYPGATIKVEVDPETGEGSLKED